MKKIITSSLILIYSLSAFSQDAVSLNNDSAFDLSPPVQGHPIKMKSGFGILNETNNALYLFSENAVFIDSINFTLPPNSKIKRIGYKFLFETREYYVLLSGGSGNFLYFDKTGNLYKTIKIKQKYKGSFYFITDTRTSPICGFYNDKSSSFFTPVHPAAKRKESRVEFSTRKSLKFGYIGEFNEEGKMIAVHGKYDPLYYKGELSHLDDPQMDVFNGEMIHSQNLSYNITFQKIGSQESETFGVKGKNIEKTPAELPKILSRNDWFLYETTRAIESYFYWSLNISNKYIFRTYTKSIKDSVPADPEDITFIQKYLDGEIKGCMPSTNTERRQRELMRTKPFFLQVYSRESKELLFDEPINFRYPHFLGSKNDSVLFLEWAENEKYRVHRLDFTNSGNNK